MKVWAEKVGSRIEVHFNYDPVTVSKIKTVPGARFVPRDKGGPHWSVALDLESCRILREKFGQELGLGQELIAWGTREVKKEQQMKSLATADSAELKRLPQVLPKLHEAVHLGPKGKTMTPAERRRGMKKPGSFQAADVAFMATADSLLNGNQPGLGKTLETIGAIFEAGTDQGRHLVVAPKTALESVWKLELETWQNYRVWVCTGSRQKRLDTIAEFMATTETEPGWLVVNPDMVRFRREEPSRENDWKVKLVSGFPALHETEWSNLIIDEAHKNAVRHPETPTAKGMFALKVKEGGKRYALTGTPLGGKPINLWGILHYLKPDVFSSKWRWAAQWLEIEDNGYGKKIGDLRPEREDAFYEHLQPYMLRRRKDEVLTDLPPKQYVDLWVEFGSDRHKKQYQDFNRDAEVKIDEEKLSATSILAEYTRLKQFASAYHIGGPTPTNESGKVAMLEELLDERGILDGEGTEQVVIFSQFEQIVSMLSQWLDEKKVPHLTITGKINKAGQRRDAQQQFQAGEVRVMLMTTTAGGVAITLDRASTVIFMDETWTPDDQEQAEDRCHRASRIHQVTVYYLRTKGTIEEYIQEIGLKKQAVNELVLDLKRRSKRNVA